MTLRYEGSVPNNGDWKENHQWNDKSTDELIDFTGAYIEIEVKDSNRCPKIEASTTNGKITILSTGVYQLLIPASEMKCICAGQYSIGGLYTLNDETISLFTGTISIVEGVAHA